MTNETKTQGHIVIDKNAQSGAVKYINYFKSGELKLFDAVTVWLSHVNYNNIAFSDAGESKTGMALDNADMEIFYNKTKKDDVMPIVKYKEEKLKFRTPQYFGYKKHF